MRWRLKHPSQALLLVTPESNQKHCSCCMVSEDNEFICITSNHPSTDYAKTVTSYPRKQEKLQLLEHIRAIPGHDSYTYEKISSWFARHRIPSHALRDTGREWSVAGHKATPSPTDRVAPYIQRFADDDSIRTSLSLHT